MIASPLFSLSSFPQLLSAFSIQFNFFLSLQERAGLLWISTNHAISPYQGAVILGSSLFIYLFFCNSPLIEAGRGNPVGERGLKSRVKDSP